MLVKLTPDAEIHFFSDVLEECEVQSTKLLNARIIQWEKLQRRRCRMSYSQDATIVGNSIFWEKLAFFDI